MKLAAIALITAATVGGHAYATRQRTYYIRATVSQHSYRAPDCTGGGYHGDLVTDGEALYFCTGGMWREVVFR